MIKSVIFEFYAFIEIAGALSNHFAINGSSEGKWYSVSHKLYCSNWHTWLYLGWLALSNVEHKAAGLSYKDQLHVLFVVMWMFVKVRFKTHHESCIFIHSSSSTYLHGAKRWPWPKSRESRYDVTSANRTTALQLHDKLWNRCVDRRRDYYGYSGLLCFDGSKATTSQKTSVTSPANNRKIVFMSPSRSSRRT